MAGAAAIAGKLCAVMFVNWRSPEDMCKTAVTKLLGKSMVAPLSRRVAVLQ